MGIAERAEFSARINRLLLTLISIQTPDDENLALVLVGHLEAVFTTAQTKSPVDSVYIFHDVLFSKKTCTFGKTPSRQIFGEKLFFHSGRTTFHVSRRTLNQKFAALQQRQSRNGRTLN
ncbi:hypothetical protein Rcae01_03495 [Novipirellula caenicola]|uniref:Uncharacterized protein n=1 Tax=Novipirellula caenicola TaxID=1536901 RepID=A0ABP9VSC0_9BACT